MDIRYETEYKFLNLSDLDETSKNEINTILKSHGETDFLKLPWEIGKNDIENNVTKCAETPELPKWPSYETDQMKYDNIPVQQNIILPQITSRSYGQYVSHSNNWAVPHLVVPCSDMNFMPVTYQHKMYTAPPGNEAQEMVPMRGENRKGRLRGNKRGGNGSDSFTNRNHNINHNHNMAHNKVHGYIGNDINQYMHIVQRPIIPISDLNGSQQHAVTGPPFFYGQPCPMTFATAHTIQQPMMNTYSEYGGNPKYIRPNPMMPPSNGEVIHQMHPVRSGPPKDRQDKHYYTHYHRGQNNRGRTSTFRQVEEDNNIQPTTPSQTNIVTTTTKVVVKNNQPEESINCETESEKSPVKDINNGKNIPVNVKIEHTVMSTINSNNSGNNDIKESKAELSRVNINSSIEVQHNRQDTDIQVNQSPESKEQPQVQSVKTVRFAPIEEKSKETSVARQEVTVTKNEHDDKSAPKIEKPAEEPVVSIKSTPTTSSPTLTAPTIPVPTAISFANMLKKGTNNVSAVKPIAKINPLNVVSTANNPVRESNETKKDKVRQNNTNTNPPVINSARSQNSQKHESNTQENNGIQTNNSNCAVTQVRDYCDDPITYRMGEILHSYQMDKQTVSLLPRGLTNRSNYCYINSILQALLACPPFYNLLMAMPYSKNSSKRNSVSPLLDNMIRFVHEFTPLSDGARLFRKDRSQKRNENAPVDIQSDVPFEPVYVYTMLKNTSSVFSVEGRQEDAEEFLSCLLNGISDEMLELMKIASNDKNATEQDSGICYSNGEEEWKVMGPKNKGSITRCTEFGRTPLSDIFRGQLRSRVTRSGEQSTDYIQPFFTLQLDIEKAENVKEAFEILVGKDQVEGMTCSKTKQQIEAWKQVSLEELPVILILHLKWFDYKLDGCSKILKQVEFPVNFRVDPKYLSLSATKKFVGKQRLYKLFAVTYHDGKEATKGHYLTDAFHVGYGCWVRYDDNSVKGIPEGNVLKPQPPRVPYLLYYRRQDTIGNSSNNSNANTTTNNNQVNNVRSR